MSYDAVKAQNAELHRTFEERYDDLSAIAVAVKDRLKRLVAEGELDEDTAVWALRSVDIPTLFRFYKKNKWNKTAAVSALVKNAVWRSNTIPYLPTPPAIPLLRFLSLDRFGRPILIIRARLLATTSKNDLKSLILTTYELGRLYLAHLYSQSTDVFGASSSMGRVLQFTLIADLQGLGIRDVPMDLVPWISETIIPNYPGIIGPSYIINYSWAYNGVWQLCKRVLPQRAIARIFFPSHSELREHIPPESLLEEHGGRLKPPGTRHDPLLPRYLPGLVSPSSTTLFVPSTSASTTPVAHFTSPTFHKDSITASRKKKSQKLPPSSPSPLPLPPRRPRISPRSHMNPYYGYPVVYDNAAGLNQVPRLAAGRRRKRDLAKTLLILLIRRLAMAIPNIFLKPAVGSQHWIGFMSGGIRRLRPWIWWTLCFWLVASLRKVLRIRRGAIMSRVVGVEGRLRNMGIGLLVGGEFLRRLWVPLNLASGVGMPPTPA